jgi:O-antigen/teichoic acid export membrane protein
MAVMNVTTYAFNIVAVYLLSPGEYGVTAAVMGLVNVANVMALGLQAAGARHMAGGPPEPETIRPAVLRLAWQAGAVLSASCLLTAPLLDRGLGISQLTATAMLGLAMLPLTVFGGQAGILQGTQRWSALAAMYVTLGITRLLAGAIGMWWSPSATASLVAVAAAAWAPVLVGALLLREPRPLGRTRVSRLVAEEVKMLREILHNSHALLALFSVSVADVLIAKVIFDDHRAGLYAAGSIVTKAVMFLPQFVVVMAFPSMASPDRPRWIHLKALGVVAALGLLCVTGSLLLPDLALLLTGGEDFAAIGPLLPWFAGLGTVLAMLQVLLYDAMARRLRGGATVLWLAVGVLVVIGSRVVTSQGLVTAVLSTLLVTLAVLLVVGSVPTRSPRPDQEVGESEAESGAGG